MANKKTYKSYAGHGIDVASLRADDLDKLMLEHLAQKSVPRVLDLGCGAGGHSVRIAKTGAIVTAVDAHDFYKEFNANKQTENLPEEQLKFIRGDITKITELINGEQFTDACIQRTIHYLKYKQAVDLLIFLQEIVQNRLYISVTGLDSGVGENYQGKGIAVEERFFPLNPDKADTYSIHEPVCLYSKAEFETLLEKTGWAIERSWESAFGNLKAVCSNRQIHSN